MPEFRGYVISALAQEAECISGHSTDGKRQQGKSVVAEVYPALWSHTFSRDGRNSDQHDAYSAAEWLRRSDLDGSLDRFFNPLLNEHERKVAEIEGWILGIA